MRYYVVDAFTDAVFAGNPAGVCMPDETLPAKTMQQIAAENNLSETAFVYKRAQAGEYDLRWFTPKSEIDLCGHATLGTAYIVSRFANPGISVMQFHTQSGILTVTRRGDLFEMDFPSRMPAPIPLTPLMEEALGMPVLEAHLSRDILFVLPDAQAVRTVTPDFIKLAALEGLGVIVTAPGDEPCVDFVSRFFCPDLGVNEDPVTGSAHCNLIPFWAERLHKTELLARQLSERGGTLYCALQGDRVKISGRAVLYLQGELFI